MKAQIKILKALDKSQIKTFSYLIKYSHSISKQQFEKHQ